MELIGTQTTKIRQQETKIMQQEAKISELMKAKDIANKEITSLKQKIPAPRKLPKPSDEPSNPGKSQLNLKLTPNQPEAEVEETMIPPCHSLHDPASGQKAGLIPGQGHQLRLQPLGTIGTQSQN